MIIFNLKIINQYVLVELLNFKTENNRCRTVKVIDFVALNKISCGSPTLTYNIERVICSGINISLISIKVKYLVNRMNKDL